MDLRRFVDLYASESQEHIALLQRSLVALERDGAGAALSEAFRASHTLKGLAAAMGYGAVAQQAHALEDRLAAVRDGREALDAALIDDLLAAADALEEAVAAAVQTPPGDALEEPSIAGARRAEASAPEGTAHIMRITLDPAAPMKGVRGTLILRTLADTAEVLGADPTEFADDFDGRLVLFLGPGADHAAIGERVRSAGDVQSVSVVPHVLRNAPGALENGQARQVRVEERRLNSVADGLAELSVLHARLSAGAFTGAVADALDRVGAVLADLDHDMRALRMVPVRQVFDRLPRVVRDARRSSGRDVDLLLSGEDVELDRTILDELFDPLVHLLRNAVDHGIEPREQRVAAGKPERGTIRVTARRERGSVCVVVADDGGGVPRARVAARARAAGLHDGPDELDDETLFRLLSHPGLSTAERVSSVSGRGVGMDVVVSRVRALGGAVDMQTRAGAGTSFTMRLPISLALAQALRVRVGGEEYAIPLTHVAEAIELEDGAASVVSVRARPVRVVRLRRVLRVEAPGRETAAVIAGIGDRRAALAVDQLLGREQIVVRSFDAAAGMLPYFSGATLLADGRPALVLDPLSLL